MIHSSVESEKEGSPDEFSYTASFAPSVLKVTSNDYSLGYPQIYQVSGKNKISKSINAAGDKVTLEAVKVRPLPSSEFSSITQASHSIRFLGWYKNGELISEDEIIEYTVGEAETLETRFERRYLEANNGKIAGYYRLQTPFSNDATNYFLTIAGNFQVNIGTDKRSLNGAVEFNRIMLSEDNTYCKSPAVYSDPGCIFYVTGDLSDAESLNATESRTAIANNLKAESQGVSTDYVVKGQELVLKAGATPGYYVLCSSSFSIQLTYSNKLWVTTDKPGNTSYINAGDFDIQPVDEKDIDINYFGAYPDESMWYEDGYWTSMYASFPFECYEPDGVEAYIVKSVADYRGEQVAVVEKLAGNIVPAATPVLLKCKSTSPKENRMLPLLPDDSRLADAKAAVEGNLLTGEYGLYTNEIYDGRKTYDESTMRVLSVSNDGVVGFYKLSANADGSAKKLQPNRAYLDLAKIPAAVNKAVSYRMIFNPGETTGIVDVEDNFNMGQDAEYYTIDGIKVDNPEPGQIYILRQGTVARKIRY